MKTLSKGAKVMSGKLAILAALLCAGVALSQVGEFLLFIAVAMVVCSFNWFAERGW